MGNVKYIAKCYILQSCENVSGCTQQQTKMFSELFLNILLQSSSFKILKYYFNSTVHANFTTYK